MDGKLLDIIYTLQKRDEALQQIDILINSKYYSSDTKEKADIVRQDLTLLGEELKEMTIEDLETLRNDLKSLPIVEIVVAFAPDKRVTAEIVHFVRKMIVNNALVSWEINSQLIAGAQITYQGKYYDGSLLSKLS